MPFEWKSCSRRFVPDSPSYQSSWRGRDDPQTIFETLNSRGIELSAADLMRNYIFQRAKNLGLAEGELRVDRLYQMYWLPLDGASWQLEETRGRQTKPRLDWLLVDHLAMKRAELVSADTLFEQYRRWINNKDPFAADVEVELQSIAASAAVHRRIAEQDADDLLGAFGRFARAFDVSTAMPLVLFLATEAKFGDEALADALRMIASFIVRRDVCGLPTGSYNKFFIDLVAALREAETIDVTSLRTAMSASQAEITRWPTDEEWRQNWLGRGDQHNGQSDLADSTPQRIGLERPFRREDARRPGSRRPDDQPRSARL